MPDLGATCSLDEGCPADLFGAFCDAHPDRTVVVYANTSAAVKARADWMVTSGIALPIVRYLHERGERSCGHRTDTSATTCNSRPAPISCCGKAAASSTRSSKASPWRGSSACTPNAAVLVHPESPEDVLQYADVVGSTTALIKAVAQMPNEEFIVATDDGIFWKMHQLAPEKN